MTGTLQATPRLATNFKFIIDDEAFQKVMYWVNKSNHEVSGFGNAEFDPATGIFRITDAFLLKQDNGPTSSEIDANALNKAMFLRREKPNGLKWWWHSHVTMAVFWSSDDMNCIRGLGQRSWVTATVFNKKCEMRSAFYELGQVMGREHENFVDDIPTEIDRKLTQEQMAAWDAEYAENVAEKKYSTITSNYYSRGNGLSESESGTAGNQSDFNEWLDRKYGGNHKKDSSDSGLFRSGGEHYETWRSPYPKPPSVTDDDLEEQGYVWSEGLNEWIYNPLKDKSLRSEAEQWEWIGLMDRKEFSALYREDEEFRKFAQAADSTIIPGE